MIETGAFETKKVARVRTNPDLVIEEWYCQERRKAHILQGNEEEEVADWPQSIDESPAHDDDSSTILGSEAQGP